MNRRNGQINITREESSLSCFYVVDFLISIKISYSVFSVEGDGLCICIYLYQTTIKEEENITLEIILRLSEKYHLFLVTCFPIHWFKWRREWLALG